MPQFEQPSSITPTQAESSMPAPKTNFRWTICGLLFFITAINYIDRQILAILKPRLTHDLGWNEYDYANIVSVFQFTYAFGYLFGGRIMDWIGIKRGFPWAAGIWSLAAAGHGLARTVLGFSIGRFFLGIAEGCNFPAAIRVVSEWFPIKDRALATGIFNSASNVGALICPLTVPMLANTVGWPMAFFITGALGFIWIVVWKMVYDNPETHPQLSQEERDYIQSGRTLYSEQTLPWLSLFKYRSTWAYTIANVLATPVWWFYLFWIPGFLSKRFNLSLQQTGNYTAVIYAIAIIGSIAGGWLAAKLINRGWSLNAARKTALLIPALCVVPVCTAASVHSVWAAVLVVGLAAGSHQAWSANFFTFVSDTTPRKAVSSVVGMGGFTSGIASIFVAQAVPKVLEKTGSYVPLFIWASSMYLISLLVVQILVPHIEDRSKEPPAEEVGISTAE